MYIADEDMTVRFMGFEVVPWRRWAWRFACGLSIGMLALLGHWFPRTWLRWVTKERAFRELDEGFVVVEVRSAEFGQDCTQIRVARPRTRHCRYFQYGD